MDILCQEKQNIFTRSVKKGSKFYLQNPNFNNIVFYFQADMYIGHHGEKMLESFCKWQHEEFGKKNDIHLEMSTSWGEDMTSVDAAILITR